MNGVIDNIMRTAFGAGDFDGFLAVAINEVVDDQRVRVARANENAALAFTCAIAVDAVAFYMNRPVLSLIAAKELDGLPAGVGDSKSTQGDEFGRFDLNRIAFGAFLTGATQNDAARVASGSASISMRSASLASAVLFLPLMRMTSSYSPA